jgi:hypothetical protein
MGERNAAVINELTMLVIYAIREHKILNRKRGYIITQHADMTTQGEGE